MFFSAKILFSIFTRYVVHLIFASAFISIPPFVGEKPKTLHTLHLKLPEAPIAVCGLVMLPAIVVIF